MTKLGPNARNLIELARREDDPDEAARARVQEAFRTRLNSELAAGSDHGLGYSAAKSALATKSVALLAVFGAAVGGGWALYSQPTTALGTGTPPSSSLGAIASPPSVPGRLRQPLAAPGEAERAAVSSRSADSSNSNLGMARARPARETLPERASTAPAPESEPPSPPEPRDASPGRRERDRVAAVERSAPNDASAVETERSASSSGSSATSGVQPATPAEEALLAEARALREVQKLLRDGNSARALTLLAKQDRQFANGQLSEARAAARSMAVCTNQSAQDRRQTAAAFEARWPRSILLSRVRSACESSEGQPGKTDD